MQGRSVKKCYMCEKPVEATGCSLDLYWSGGIAPQNYSRSIRQNLCSPNCLRDMLLYLAGDVPFTVDSPNDRPAPEHPRNTL